MSTVVISPKWLTSKVAKEILVPLKKILKEAEKPMKPRDPKFIRQVLEDWCDGISDRKLAKKYGVSTRSICKWRKKAREA